MSYEIRFSNRQILEFIWPYLTIGTFLIIIIGTFWNTPSDIARISAIVAIFALVFTLALERAKNERRFFIRKNELTVYKRNLLFKLNGIVGAAQWALSTYITYDIDTSSRPSLKINYTTLGNFTKIQLESHKINYDDVRFFSTSDAVPMEIKEKLDLLNLDGEKLIIFLPIQKGTINRTIFTRYTQKIFDIINWSLENEDSDELINNAKNLVKMVEVMINVTTNPKFNGFI